MLKDKGILAIILIIFFLCGMSYLKGFYRGMDECKKIYTEYRLEE